MKKIAIIVLNWRTPVLTVGTVKSLLKIRHPGFEYQIYIVDNGSGDDSVPVFTKEFSANSLVTLVETGSNLGYVDGNNYGIRLAQKENFDYYLIINSDVEVKPDFLDFMYRYLEANPSFGVVGPKIYFAPGYEFHKDRYKKNDLGKVIWSFGGIVDWNNIYGSNAFIDEIDRGQFNTINTAIDYLSGCCLLIKREVFDTIGLFDSKYFMYSEDADFSQRVIKAGFKIACLPRSVIWHINSGSSGRGPIHDYFLTRNRLLFGFRYASWRTRLALIRDSARIFLTSPYVWQKYGIRDYYLGILGKGSWK